MRGPRNRVPLPHPDGPRGLIGAEAYSKKVSATIEDVRARAKHLFRTEQSADAFLNVPCKQLGGVPVELANHGHADRVLSYLEHLEERAPPDTPDWWAPGYRGAVP